MVVVELAADLRSKGGLTKGGLIDVEKVEVSLQSQKKRSQYTLRDAYHYHY
jgi:hypothetical protein